MLDLHKILGYSCPNDRPHSKNSARIRELLMLLSEAGLVKYIIKSGRNSKNAPIDIYKLTMVRSNVSEMYMQSYKRLKESGEINEDGSNIEE